MAQVLYHKNNNCFTISYISQSQIVEQEKWSHPLIVDEDDDEATSSKEATSATPHLLFAVSKHMNI